MINQQLLDYIKQQLHQGKNPEQIKSDLVSMGWSLGDIGEGFALDLPVISPKYSETVVKSPTSKLKIIAGIFIIMVIFGGGLYQLSNRVANVKPKEAVDPTETPSQQDQSQDPEIIFAEKLRTCSEYKTTFKHPFTGEVLEKEIRGEINGKCYYAEQMPNGGKMECKYSRASRWDRWSLCTKRYQDVLGFVEQY